MWKNVFAAASLLTEGMIYLNCSPYIVPWNMAVISTFLTSSVVSLGRSFVFSAQGWEATNKGEANQMRA